MIRFKHIPPRLPLVVLWFASMCLLMVAGCEPVATEQPAVPNGEANNPAVYWRPTPTRVRVYPSTRFIEESGRAILEARFELFDEMGDPVKAAGSFRIELHSIDESLGNTPQRLLYTWNAETMTLDQQREHYDPITRGYLFRLGVDNLRIAKQATLLRVAFTPVDRPRLEDDSIIRSDW